MNSKQNTFIETIAPIIMKEAKARGYHVCSAIIAQACLESAWGQSTLASVHHNYFGMKCGSSWTGKRCTKSTNEEYTPGQYTTIKADFRAYDSMEDGVKGYFDFISTKRYAALKQAQTAQSYLELIKSAGYATSSTYVRNNMSIVDKYALCKYDDMLKSDATPNVISEYYDRYEGTSSRIDIVFEAIGVPKQYIGSYRKRRPIAEANGIDNYRGTLVQNLTLIAYANNGKLRRP